MTLSSSEFVTFQTVNSQNHEDYECSCARLYNKLHFYSTVLHKYLCWPEINSKAKHSKNTTSDFTVPKIWNKYYKYSPRFTQICSGVVSRKVNGKGAKNTGRNGEFSNRVALSVLSSEKLWHKPQVPLILGSKNYMSKCYVDPFLRLVHQQL